MIETPEDEDDYLHQQFSIPARDDRRERVRMDDMWSSELP